MRSKCSDRTRPQCRDCRFGKSPGDDPPLLLSQWIPVKGPTGRKVTEKLEVVCLSWRADPVLLPDWHKPKGLA